MEERCSSVSCWPSRRAWSVAVPTPFGTEIIGTTYFFLAPIAIPLLILGVPIFDTIFAIVRRATSRSSLATADKGHLHHRLIDLGHGHRRSVLILWTWTALLSALRAVSDAHRPEPERTSRSAWRHSRSCCTRCCIRACSPSDVGTTRRLPASSGPTPISRRCSTGDACWLHSARPFVNVDDRATGLPPNGGRALGCASVHKRFEFDSIVVVKSPVR